MKIYTTIYLGRNCYGYRTNDPVLVLSLLGWNEYYQDKIFVIKNLSNGIMMEALGKDFEIISSI